MTDRPFAHEPVLAESELRHLVLAAQREGNRELAKVLAPFELSPSQSEVIRVI